MEITPIAAKVNNQHDEEPSIEGVSFQEKKTENKHGVVSESSKRREVEGENLEPAGTLLDTSDLSHSTESNVSHSTSLETRGRGKVKFKSCFILRPSFSRDEGQRRPFTLEVEPVRDVVFIVVTAAQTNHEERGTLDRLVGERAECKFCSIPFEVGNAVMLQCGCGEKRFIHEDCEPNWSRERGNNCGDCGQEVQNSPVTLKLGKPSDRL